MPAVSRFSLSHLSDAALQRDLVALVAKDRATTAELLAHLAELDRRRLYRERNFDSLYEYCVRDLKLSEDCAKKRIRAARTARQYPGIFAALADGRLSLTAVLMLSRHLTRQNARELLTAAERKSNAEVEALLAARYPQPDWPTVIVPLAAVPAAVAGAGPALATVWAAAGSAFEGAARPPHVGQATFPQPVTPIAPETHLAGPSSTGAEGGPASARPTPPSASDSTPRPAAVAEPLATGALAPPMPPARIAVLAPDHIGLQFVVSQATHDKLVRATELLGHAVPDGNLAKIFDRALDALIAKLEKRKFGATDRPRAAKACRSTDPRVIPNDVRRAVWKRDGGRCTYVGSGGCRCESRRRLEFDHVQPVALGGQAIVANLRLRCRAHNQLAAEEILGAQRMVARREQADRARAAS